MRDLMKKYALFTALAASSQSIYSPKEPYQRKSRGRIEVEEALDAFKCTPEELKEKCLRNKKMLSKYGNMFLDQLIETRKNQNYENKKMDY